MFIIQSNSGKLVKLTARLSRVIAQKELFGKLIYTALLVNLSYLIRLALRGKTLLVTPSLR